MFGTKFEPQNRLLNKDKMKFLLNESDSTVMKLEGPCLTDYDATSKHNCIQY